jgi:hypothetical protein
LVKKFKEARNSSKANSNIYLGLMTYRLSEEEIVQIAKYLRFSKEQIRMINEIKLTS